MEFRLSKSVYITHGVRMSLLPGVISVSEKFLELEKNEINFGNLKLNTCPVNLFHFLYWILSCSNPKRPV